MSGVFISYRRDDSAGHAGRLFDRLAGHFGSHRVFMDVDTIKPGEDFAGVIDEHIARCDVLLALIGNGWLSSSHDSGQRRLDDPEDFVRLEIVSALNRGIVVIPVLVENIPMPAAKILPSALQRLARLQALGLANARFQDDVEKLIETIERYLVSPIGPTLSGNSRLRRAGAIFAVVFGLGLLLGLLWVSKPGTSPPAASMDVSGKWIAQVLVKDDRHYTLVLELEMTGNRILGRVQYPAGSGGVREGSIERGRVSFITIHRPQFSDQDATTRFEGQLVNEELDLVMQYDDVVRRIRARRQPS